MALDNGFEVIIGLEIHAQLLTNTKLFCNDSTDFGEEANTQTSVVSLAFPGTLPRLNREAIKLAITLGLATNCQIVRENYFARKNYFYPDLPKGYQISQHTTPICKTGFVEISVGEEKKIVRLNRIHLEEDAGKSIHETNIAFTQLDFNRAGIPLVEIVTEPDMRSSEEAAAFVSTIRKLVRQLKVCDGNMEEGSFRCDVNISVRKKGDLKLGTKVEIKNLNSIRFIRKAIDHEKKLLIDKLEASEIILQQTKGFDEKSSSTYIIRTKENEDDYRYFPEPDLPPFIISNEQVNAIKASIPPLQDEIQQTLTDGYGLTSYSASQIANDPELAELFLQVSKTNENYKAIANWVTGPIKNYLDEEMASATINASAIAEMIELIDKGIITYTIASQKVFPAVIAQPKISVRAYIEQAGLQIQSEDETDAHITAALTKYAQKITEYKKGKKGLLSLFVGEVMRLSKGKANAEEVTKKILDKIN